MPWLTLEKARVRAPSPWPCSERNSAPVARAGCVGHFASQSIGSVPSGASPSPGSGLQLSGLGAGKAKPCLLRFPTQPRRGAAAAARVELEPARESRVKPNLPEPAL